MVLNVDQKSDFSTATWYVWKRFQTFSKHRCTFRDRIFQQQRYTFGNVFQRSQTSLYVSGSKFSTVAVFLCVEMSENVLNHRAAFSLNILLCCCFSAPAIVCVYVCMCACICVCMYTFMLLLRCRCDRVCICMYVCMHVCMYVDSCVAASVPYDHAYTCMHVCIYVCM